VSQTNYVVNKPFAGHAVNATIAIDDAADTTTLQAAGYITPAVPPDPYHRPTLTAEAPARAEAASRSVVHAITRRHSSRSGTNG
jgi:hypothetical protein